MKQKIIQESILLFENKGFNATSIQDIVDALNVTKGTFYYYFSSKEQLLMTIHHEYIEDLLNRQQIILGSNLSYREKLEQVVYLLISDIASQGPAGRVFFREMRHLSNANGLEIREKRDQFRQNIEAILTGGIESGEFRQNLQANILAFAVLGMANWSYQWYQPAGKVSPEQLTSIYVELLLNGILPNA